MVLINSYQDLQNKQRRTCIADERHQFSSVQSLDRLGRRGDMRNKSAPTVFHPFPQEALASSSRMGRRCCHGGVELRHFRTLVKGTVLGLSSDSRCSQKRQSTFIGTLESDPSNPAFHQSTHYFYFYNTTVLSHWDFSNGKFGLPLPTPSPGGNASSDRVALPNLQCMLGDLVFP